MFQIKPGEKSTFGLSGGELKELEYALISVDSSTVSDSFASAFQIFYIEGGDAGGNRAWITAESALGGICADLFDVEEANLA